MASGMHNQEDTQFFASSCLASLSSDKVSLCGKEVIQTLPLDWLKAIIANMKSVTCITKAHDDIGEK